MTKTAPTTESPVLEPAQTAAQPLAVMPVAEPAHVQATEPGRAIAAFSNAQAFSDAQRIARGLSASSLVPQAYRGTEGMPNVLIALELANRIGASPLMVMQNLHVVQGRPGWSSSFLIATVNASGKFTPLRFEKTGDDAKDKKFRCRAYAEDRAGGAKCIGSWIDWPMIEAEGWLSKNGSKWKTMPEQMFMYRAAAFWARAFAPELSLGMQTTDELADVYGGMPDVSARAITNNDPAAVDAALLGAPTTKPQQFDPDTGELLPAELQS